MAIAPQISAPVLPPKKSGGKKSANQPEQKGKSKKTNIVDFPALQRAKEKKPRLHSRGQKTKNPEEEWLKSILPPNRGGSWWECPADAKGFKIKLRWREGAVKRAHPFSRLGMREVATLREKSYEQQREIIADRIFGELYRAGRRDIAWRLYAGAGDRALASGTN